MHFPLIRGYGECTIKKPKSLLYHVRLDDGPVIYGYVRRNWTFLPDQEPPPGPPDAVLSVYRREGVDVFVSCYQKEETAVIWTAPFVYNIANDMRSINECYHMSANAMEHLLSWTP